MNNLREYKVAGKRAVFNKESFRILLTRKSYENKITKSKLEVQIADKIGVSANTVHKWNYNGGGPIDYPLVEKLAEALGVADVSLLLTFIDNEGYRMTQLTDRQKSAAKCIYNVCIRFLDEFYYTDGFNDYWPKFKDAGSQDPESDIYDLVYDMINNINMVLKQEYFDLWDCKIYDELYEFVNEDLIEIYNGKLSYAYRFEAIPGVNTTTSEDYDLAMIRLNSIIDKYVYCTEE